MSIMRLLFEAEGENGTRVFDAEKTKAWESGVKSEPFTLCLRDYFGSRRPHPAFGIIGSTTTAQYFSSDPLHG